MLSQIKPQVPWQRGAIARPRRTLSQARGRRRGPTPFKSLDLPRIRLGGLRGLAAGRPEAAALFPYRSRYAPPRRPLSGGRLGSAAMLGVPVSLRVSPSGGRLAGSILSGPPPSLPCGPALRGRTFLRYPWWCPSVNFFKFQPCDHTPPGAQEL